MKNITYPLDLITNNMYSVPRKFFISKMQNYFKNVVLNIIQQIKINKSKPKLVDVLARVKDMFGKEIVDLTRDEKDVAIGQIRKLYDPKY